MPGDGLLQRNPCASPHHYRPYNRKSLTADGNASRCVRSDRIRGHACGLGSLSNLILGTTSVRGPRDVLAAQLEAGIYSRLLHLGLLRRGIFTARMGMLCLSTPMGDAEIDLATAALLDALEELRPLIERERPALLA